MSGSGNMLRKGHFIMRWCVFIVGVLGVSGGVLLASQTQHQSPRMPTHILDLLIPRDSRSGGAIPEGERLRLPFGRNGDARVSHEPPPAQPLSLRLIGLDRTTYVIGDQVIYELLVTNRGDTVVGFPTSTDGTRFHWATPKAVGAFVNLQIDDPQLGSQVIGTQALYGAPGIPSSVIAIGPSETLEIRAMGTWYLQSQVPKPPPDGWSRDIKVRASLHLFAEHGAPPRVQSTNAVDIRLRQR